MFVYILIKLAIFILFLFLLRCMLNILRYEQIFCEIDESIASYHNPLKDMIFLDVLSEPIFPFMQYFFLKKTVFPLVSFISYLSPS